jgi:hypothetical protein
MSLLEMIKARRAELEALEVQREEMAGAEFRASLTDEDRARALAAFIAKIDMSQVETAHVPLDERDQERARHLSDFLNRFPAVFADPTGPILGPVDAPSALAPKNSAEREEYFAGRELFPDRHNLQPDGQFQRAVTEWQLPPLEMPPMAPELPMPPDADTEATRDPRFRLLSKLNVEMYGAAKALEMASLPLDYQQAKYEMRRRRADSVVADRYAAQRRAANDPADSSQRGPRWMVR